MFPVISVYSLDWWIGEEHRLSHVLDTAESLHLTEVDDQLLETH